MSSEPNTNDVNATKDNQISGIVLNLHPTNDDHIRKKQVALLFSSFVALAAGTPYLYGVYSPQLINRCGFSAISSSYLSFSGNVGSSIGGFVAGLIIDTYGVKIGLLLGALLQFTGFSVLHFNYKYFIHNFFYLIVSMFSIGFGSVLAYFATIKVSTVNFPKHRGIANALPVSSYGLAALFFASISTIWFSDDIQGLLKFIALFSGIVIFASSFFIKIYDDTKESLLQNENHRFCENDDVVSNIDDREPLSHSSTRLQTALHDIERGAEYLLKGHRGSFAQVSNIIRQSSSGSLFSNISSSITNSLHTSSFSSNREPNEIKPLVINKGNFQHGIDPTNLTSASPLMFRSQRSSNQTNLLRLGTSQNSMSKNIDSTSSTSPMGKAGMMLPTFTDINIIDKADNEHSLVMDTDDHLKNYKFMENASLGPSFYGSVPSNNVPVLDEQSIEEQPLVSINKNFVNETQLFTIRQHIWCLFTNNLFVLHYILNATYCAIGQNYIYGIGFIVRAQVDSSYARNFYPDGKLDLGVLLNDDTAVAYQALQVSIISFSNFLGRLIAGPMSDFIHKKHHMNKLYVIIISLLLLLLGQISLVIFDNVQYLGFTSFLIGSSYGAIYATMPSIAADLFGSTNFATTWSLIGTGPINVFLILSNYFGDVYDRQSEWIDIGGDRIKICLKGKSCYSEIFKSTTFLSCILLVGYIVALHLSNHR